MINVVSGIMLNGNAILACQRRQDQTLPLRWYLPGGKVEIGESQRTALQRELFEELGIYVSIKDISDVKVNFHIEYKHGMFNVNFYSVKEYKGVPVNKEHANMKWIVNKGIDDYDWLEGDLLVAKLAFMERFGNGI